MGKENSTEGIIPASYKKFLKPVIRPYINETG
jgi:hypothetical protein